MREFDDFEKQIIRKLKTFKEKGIYLNFLSILDDYYKDRAIEIKRDTKEGWIQFDTKKFANYDKNINAWIPKQDLVKEIAPSIDIIIRIIFLLSYLEKNGLIFLYDFATSNENISSFPKLNTPPEPTRLPLPDKKVIDLLIDYYYKEIFISQSIVNLVNNEFKTKDEIQHEETIAYANKSLKTGEESIKTANFAVIVSIIIGSVGLVVAGYSTYQTYQISQKPIDINTTQLKVFENKAYEMTTKLNRLDSINLNGANAVARLDSLVKCFNKKTEKK